MKNTMIYVPNLLTFLRIALVPWLIVALREDQYLISLLIFVAAGITDALDGYIAKRFNAITKLGEILDPLADKALLVSSYVMLTMMGIVPFWLTVAVVFRDILIVSGYLIIILFFSSAGFDEVKTRPLKISKLNTFLQITFIVFVLSALAWSLELTLVTQIFSYMILITSVLSGAAYVYIGSVKATKYSESSND